MTQVAIDTLFKVNKLAEAAFKEVLGELMDKNLRWFKLLQETQEVPDADMERMTQTWDLSRDTIEETYQKMRQEFDPSELHHDLAIIFLANQEKNHTTLNEIKQALQNAEGAEARAIAAEERAKAAEARATAAEERAKAAEARAKAV